MTASGTNLSYAWTLDGNATSGNAANLSINPSALSAGNHPVVITVTGECGTASANATLTVNPLPAPTIAASGATTFCQGGSVTLTASAASSYAWSNGATTQAITVNASGNYSVTVTDANGCTGTSAPTSLTVNPLPTPTITASSATTFCQGGSVTLTASAASSYAWSNGATTQAITVNAAGSYSVTVTNGNGCQATSTAMPVSVNPLPSATVSGTAAICPGASATLQATLSGTGPWTLTWSDGVVQNVSSSSVTRVVSPTVTTTYSLTNVTDANCSAAGSGNAIVTVNSATAITTQPVSLTRNAGQSASFSVTATGTGLSYQWRKNGSNLSGAMASSYTIASVTAADAGNYDVVVTGTCGSVTSNVAVLTVNGGGCGTPVVSITAPVSGAIYPVGTPVNFVGAFSDTGGQPHAANWSFTSNLVNAKQSGAVSETAATVNASYSFTQAGVYLVTLAVTNNCGNSGSSTTIAGLPATVVIYDPNGGLITGVGLISSPPGAYPSNPSLTGNAAFAFASKYLKGATFPFGETLFKLANLNFNSTSSEWLVVAGARAQLKGSGKINNTGAYGFILTVIDGQISGGGGQDKFRIKIWDKTTNSVVYDNQINALDSADPTTRLVSGGIVIYRNGGNAALLARQAMNDFDGDGKSDLWSYRPADGRWLVEYSSDHTLGLARLGFVEATAAPADYDGDGKADPAVYYASASRWQIRQSTTGELRDEQFGALNGQAFPADYDGDGKADLAVRETDGRWQIRLSNDGEMLSFSLGDASDHPFVGDFDGAVEV